MGQEIDLLCDYPRTKRQPRIASFREREIARKFDREFFDGDRSVGYGGFTYHPRFWQKTVKRIAHHYALDEYSAILDVGCGKGFMLRDFREMMPGATLRGVDISRYAIHHADPLVRDFCVTGDAKDLVMFAPGQFELVISINTIHNLPIDECRRALREIERVKMARGHAFVTVDAWRNPEERRAMEAWNLTARTMMSCKDWVKFFKDAGYTGDYYWFIPEMAAEVPHEPMRGEIVD